MNIVHFSDRKNNALELVGGKGSNLITLYSNKFNVPNGFVVSTQAYRDHIYHNDILPLIQSKTKKLNVNNHQIVQGISSLLQNEIVKGKVQKQLEKEITDALKKLRGNKFAVRSSSQAEDLDSASFAGQQDSYLNVPRKKVVEHVKKCWASLYTPRALFYRSQQKVSQEIAIAVVVQEMVDAEYAGVMFTLDPIHKKFMLIEIVSGLGEKLVSGQVTPNTYFLDRKTHEIGQHNVTAHFDESWLPKIATTGLSIEKHYGNPQDIEFALKNNKIFILQSRPITT